MARVFLEQGEVSERLQQLGVAKENLREVIDRMVLVRRNITENHPPNAAGWMAWSEGTCRLRDEFIPFGWEKNEDSRISSIHKDQIRIAVCNTDDGTGLENSQPMNRSRKGAGTDHVVSLNQGILGDILEQVDKVIQLPGAVGGVVYWYLCVFCSGDVVRAELSCPLACENGYFSSFRERIILIGNDDDGGVRRRSFDPLANPDGINVIVNRRQA